MRTCAGLQVEWERMVQVIITQAEFIRQVIEALTNGTGIFEQKDTTLSDTPDEHFDCTHEST